MEFCPKIFDWENVWHNSYLKCRGDLWWPIVSCWLSCIWYNVGLNCNRNLCWPIVNCWLDFIQFTSTVIKRILLFKPQMLQYFNQFIAGSANIEFITPALVWTAFRCNQPMTYGTFPAMIGGILSTRGALYCDLRFPYLDVLDIIHCPWMWLAEQTIYGTHECFHWS